MPDEVRYRLEAIQTHLEDLFLAILYYLGVHRSEAWASNKGISGDHPR